MTEFEIFIAEHKQQLGIHQYGFMPVSDIVFSEEVRRLCEVNYCGMYNKKWVCPPAVGTYEECRSHILKYSRIFVFTTVHPLEDSYDFEGMMAGRSRHNDICSEVVQAFRTYGPSDALFLAGDGCDRCSTCTWPDTPCRFPDRAFPSVESYGVQVNQLAASLGINYINGHNTVTYFGCICFD